MSRPALIRVNPVAERFAGSLRREVLDHVIILDDYHLENVARQYVRHFKEARPHQGIGQRIPHGSGEEHWRASTGCSGIVELTCGG
jgi:hypothetical protein